jgi:hypothetical protein
VTVPASEPARWTPITALGAVWGTAYAAVPNRTLGFTLMSESTALPGVPSPAPLAPPRRRFTVSLPSIAASGRMATRKVRLVTRGPKTSGWLTTGA